MPLSDFDRLASLSVSTLRLRIDYLPRSEQLLVSAAVTGLSHRDSDLALVLVDELASEPATDLVVCWCQAHMECGTVPLARTVDGWRQRWGIMGAPGEQLASR